MANLKEDGDISESDSLGNQSSVEQHFIVQIEQDDSCSHEVIGDYENELNGNTSVFDYCKMYDRKQSSNKQVKLDTNLKKTNMSCMGRKGHENKTLNSDDSKRVSGEKVLTFSRRQNKKLKHNSKLWDNLKFSSEAVNSESCTEYTVIKKKNKDQNIDAVKSQIPAGSGFSLDPPDTIKQSLQKIVQKDFTLGEKDNSVNELRKVKGSKEEDDISLSGQTKVACQSHMITDETNDLDNELDISNYPFISQNQEYENSDLSSQHIDKPKRYGQRPQICGHCGKLFLDPYNFKQHLLIHSGEKPFKCDICGRGFSRNNHLTRHILIHTGEKPFHCDICGSDFSRNSTLGLHKRSHTKEKNYKCKICGKDFTLYWNLVVHLRIHTGERPFKCEICHKTSRQKSDFNRHMKTHTGEKPYTCFTCNTKFSRGSCLKRHWNKFHPDKPIEENVSPEENQ